MGLLFGRNFSLLLYKSTPTGGIQTGGASLQSLIKPPMRIVFTIVQSANPYPNPAQIEIHNLSQESSFLIQQQFTNFILNVGYGDDLKQIFVGNLTYKWRYRTGPTLKDEIIAADGDLGFIRSTFTRSYSPGVPPDQILNDAIATMPGITRGSGTLTIPPSTGGQVFHGMTRDVISSLVSAQNAQWNIQDNKLVIVNNGDVLPTPVVEISSQTGLLDIPITRENGVSFTCLMNPFLEPMGRVRLTDVLIRQTLPGPLANVPQDYADQAYYQSGQDARLSPTGDYKIIKVTHRGDSRSAEPKSWVSEVDAYPLNRPATDYGALP